MGWTFWSVDHVSNPTPGVYPNFRSYQQRRSETRLFFNNGVQKLALQISDSFCDPQPLGEFQAQVVQQNRLRLVGTHHAP